MEAMGAFSPFKKLKIERVSLRDQIKEDMEGMKEKAADAAASAKAGMEKTKAMMGEKVEKMRAHDDLEKDMATQKKEGRKADAELRKQEAQAHNAQQKQANTGSGI